jgi:hypothetical protein
VGKTLSFSKKLSNHIGAIWYFVHHYNAFVRSWLLLFNTTLKQRAINYIKKVVKLSQKCSEERIKKTAIFLLQVLEKIELWFEINLTYVAVGRI